MSLGSAQRICLVLSLLSIVAPAGRSESPQRVSSCQLNNDPARYNHALVQVTAFVSRGFEDFTLFDPDCPSWPPVWLEYGGAVASGAIYCCGVTADRSRSSTVQVEDVSIPLVDDERFKVFNRLIQRRPDTVVRATLVGRFFSGRQERVPAGLIWGGYGHMGCCSLLAIQQVLAVEPQIRTDLDYRASPDQPEIRKTGCGYRDFVPVESTAAFIAAQQQAERDNSEWAFIDPQRVAAVTLAKLLNIDSTTITGIRQTRKAQGRLFYEWRPKRKGKTYLIVASRPYWLSFYAKDPKRVAWIIIAAYESSCD